MDLFTPVVPQERQHPNFKHASIPARFGEREVLQRWAENFPDRDKKFVREFQTTFNSSFWEVYLHGLFKDYGFGMDWSHSSPDFHLTTPHGDVIVEAMTANAAAGSTPEWEKMKMLTDDVRNKNFWPLNREAIIRLSSALLSKLLKYRKSYTQLPHVRGRPFVIAVAPFEQPDFQHQYDRPMRALLYDDYVDETAYCRDPTAYPKGPPSVALNFVEKDNGSSIDLGIFNNDGWDEVSAVLFSCVATWGKTVAMSTHPEVGVVSTAWGTDNTGRSECRLAPIGIPSEQISDGLQVFHNPHARRPLPVSTFRREGVVQHFQADDGWSRESYGNALQFRHTQTVSIHEGPDEPSVAD